MIDSLTFSFVASLQYYLTKIASRFFLKTCSFSHASEYFSNKCIQKHVLKKRCIFRLIRKKKLVHSSRLINCLRCRTRRERFSPWFSPNYIYSFNFTFHHFLKQYCRDHPPIQNNHHPLANFSIYLIRPVLIHFE